MAEDSSWGSSYDQKGYTIQNFRASNGQPQLIRVSNTDQAHENRQNTNMKYTVQSFSWGTALLDPEIRKSETEAINEAERELNRQWQNPKCFHVRVLSPLGV